MVFFLLNVNKKRNPCFIYDSITAYKQKSDSSQDALKMSQNISIVPVKHSFLMYDMQKAQIDRLAGKIVLKKPSKWPTITEKIQDIPSTYK